MNKVFEVISGIGILIVSSIASNSVSGIKVLQGR